MSKEVLVAHTHVVDERTGRTVHFAPGGTVPDWARKQMTNPKLWAEHGGEEEEPEAPVVPAVAPSRSGPGSGKDAWAAFAEARGVGLDSGMTRDDIMAACETAGVIEPAE